MADLEHATLVDPNIHEPKGITTALANEVYIADGSNSGSWDKIGLSSLVPAAKSFSAQLAQFKQVANVTGTFPASTWTTMTLDTLTNNDISASLATNTITLPAGTYFVDGIVYAPYTCGGGFGSTFANTVKLYNNTAAADITSTSCFTFFPGADNYRSRYPMLIKDRFTIGATSNILLQMNPTIEQVYNGSASYGNTVNLMFWKLT